MKTISQNKRKETGGKATTPPKKKMYFFLESMGFVSVLKKYYNKCLHFQNLKDLPV